LNLNINKKEQGMKFEGLGAALQQPGLNAKNLQAHANQGLLQPPGNMLGSNGFGNGFKANQ
jgi:hypothetical protein